MKLEKVKIERLKEAKYNPRKRLTPADEEYQKIKNSIQEFGYCDPLLVNKDYTVIGGHQRLNVLKDLGYRDIEVIKLNLPKSKEKALNVALNKITGSWDYNKLKDLFADLEDDLDLTLTGFDTNEIESIIDASEYSFEEDLETQEDSAEEEEKENARMNTVNAYNLQLYDSENVSGFYQMPIIENDNVIPTDLIGFNYMMTSENKNVGIHCFVDDYQFERLWNSPDKYLDKLSEYEVILSPDFSLYLDMPMAMKVWNVYRSRLLGQYWQSNGIKVIPTISWAEKETFTFCFDGIPKGSIVAVSTIGVKKQTEAFNIWQEGMKAMIEKIEPRTILVYGGKLDFDYGKIKVIYFENKVTERMKMEHAKSQ